jgi:hypothetical protein
LKKRRDRAVVRRAHVAARDGGRTICAVGYWNTAFSVSTGDPMFAPEKKWVRGEPISASDDSPINAELMVESSLRPVGPR